MSLWTVRCELLHNLKAVALELLRCEPMVTYTLHDGERATRRATIWRKTAGEWQTAYHRGKVVDWDGQ